MQRPNGDLVQAVGPAPSFYGILSPATAVVEDNSDNWLGGFTYEIRDASVLVRNLSGYRGPVNGEAGVSASNGKDPFLRYEPFYVETTFTASTMYMTPAEVQARATEALNIVTQKAVEREFWTGEIAKLLDTAQKAGNRYLASVTATDVTPTPGTGIRARHAQNLLEEALNSSTLGYAGTLHAPRSVADVMRTHHGPADALVTPLGNTVVAGSGYLNTGPSGTAAASGKRWVYATGPVTVRLGEVEYTAERINQTVDSRNNTIVYVAKRPVAVTWSTTDLYAALVDLSLDYA